MLWQHQLRILCRSSGACALRMEPIYRDSGDKLIDCATTVTFPDEPKSGAARSAPCLLSSLQRFNTASKGPRAYVVAAVALSMIWTTFADSLYAAEWQIGPGHRSTAVDVPTGGATGFTLLSGSATGVAFTNVVLPARHLTNQILLNGSGVAAGDLDGDGWCDLYF